MHFKMISCIFVNAEPEQNLLTHRMQSKGIIYQNQLANGTCLYANDKFQILV